MKCCCIKKDKELKSNKQWKAEGHLRDPASAWSADSKIHSFSCGGSAQTCDELSLFYKTWCNSMCGIGPMAHPVLLPGATMVWSKSELSTNVGGSTSPGKL